MDKQKTKRCSGPCKQVKLLIHFSKDKYKKNGYATECKECRKVADKARRKRISEQNKLNPPPPIGEKRCSGCKEIHPRSDFPRDSSRSDGFAHRCFACQKAFHKNWRETSQVYKKYQENYYEENKEKISQRKKKYYEANKDWLLPQMNDRRFKKKYGITREEAKELLREQGDICPICKDGDPDSGGGWVVDHCHETGTIRGILHRTCNTGIGQLRDNKENLRNALDYLDNN